MRAVKKVQGYNIMMFYDTLNYIFKPGITVAVAGLHQQQTQQQPPQQNLPTTTTAETTAPWRTENLQ
jgi:hypothetical protein